MNAQVFKAGGVAGGRQGPNGGILEVMLTLTGILFGLAVVGLALAVAAFVVPGIECDGPVGLFLAALLYEALSIGVALLLPHAAVGVLGPLRLVGGLVFGTLILWLVGQVVPCYQVEGLGAAFFGALMVSAAMYAAGAIFAFVPLVRPTELR